MNDLLFNRKHHSYLQKSKQVQNISHATSRYHPDYKYFKKVVFITSFLLFSYKAFAPGNGTLVIIEGVPVEPFKQLIYAIGMVETGFDTLAFNPVEEAVGYFQIRPIRVDDYNKRTGSNYTVKDMYDYKISEKIFLYYASLIGPYNFRLIAMNWNGSGPLTAKYWGRVKKYL